MKLQVIKVGKPSFSEYHNLVEEYQKRLRNYTSPQSTILKAQSGKEKASSQLVKLLSQSRSQFNICCDERGTGLTSLNLAKLIAEWQENPAITQVNILVGGPYGLDESIRQQSQLMWKLSDGVLPSDLAWLIVWEQLYRGFSINAGSSYHHV